MYCKNCGRRLEEHEKFCPDCGQKKQEMNQTHPENYHVVEKKHNNTTPSIVLGILSLMIPFLGLPLAIIGLVLGIKAKKEENNKAGMILSIIGLILSALMWLLFCFFIIFAIAFDDEIDKDENTFDDVRDEFNESIPYYRHNTDISSGVKGYKWKSVDGSMLYLYSDGKYIWYQNDDDHNNDYTSGTYVIYEGEKAVDYIDKNLSEYGIDRKEQYDFFESASDNLYQIENYLYLGLNCTENITDGKKSDNGLGLVSYYGFYDDSYHFLDVANLSMSSRGGFLRVSKIDK